MSFLFSDVQVTSSLLQDSFLDEFSSELCLFVISTLSYQEQEIYYAPYVPLIVYFFLFLNYKYANHIEVSYLLCTKKLFHRIKVIIVFWDLFPVCK